VTRKELLAVVNAFNAFQHFLYSQSVLLRTDNAAVSRMRNLKQPTGQVARWLQIFGTYNFTVAHRPGTQHRNADALSRAPCNRCAKQQETHDSFAEDNNPCTPDSPPTDVFDTIRAVTRSQEDPLTAFKQTSYTVNQWSLDDIKSQQKLDPSLQFVMQLLESSAVRPSWQQISTHGNCVKSLWRMWDRLSIADGCLMRTWFDKQNKASRQIIVPELRRQDLMRYMHDIPSSAHLGTDKTLEKIRQTFYWPGMTTDVEKYCSQCHSCGARKPSKPKKSPLGSRPVVAPLERVALDILGPLPRSESGNKFVLVACDLFTHWTEAIAIPDQLAETVAKAFVNDYIS